MRILLNFTEVMQTDVAACERWTDKKLRQFFSHRVLVCGDLEWDESEVATPDCARLDGPHSETVCSDAHVQRLRNRK